MSTVTVSLKHPNGIIMQVGNKQQTIKGWNSDESLLITNIEKVGLTHNVDENLWNAWHELHKNTSLVKNGLIFANASESKVKAESKERKNEKSGLEALDRKELDKKGEKGE